MTGIPLHTTCEKTLCGLGTIKHLNTIFSSPFIYSTKSQTLEVFMKRTLSKRSGQLLRIALWNSSAYYACIAPLRICMFHSHTTGHEQLGLFLSLSPKTKKGNEKSVCLFFFYWTNWPLVLFIKWDAYFMWCLCCLFYCMFLDSSAAMVVMFQCRREEQDVIQWTSGGPIRIHRPTIWEQWGKVVCFYIYIYKCLGVTFY